MSSLHKNLLHLIDKRRFAPQQRAHLTSEIYDHIIANSETISQPNFTTISGADLGLLFQVNDELFFDGYVGRLCEEKADRPLSFRLSTRMTNAGGTTTMFRSGSRRRPKYEFEIAIATTPLFGTFASNPHGQGAASSVVGGVPCYDRVQALQRIMEHEMIHLIEMLLWNDSNCSAKPFKQIVSRFFGHTESNHQLLRPKDIAKQQLGIGIGDTVNFLHHGNQLTGMVNRITKRATILVSDPAGVKYDDGQHYQTYYVPLGRLRKAG
jgi:hypothetical protein